MRSRNWESTGISRTPKVEERLLVWNLALEATLELEQRGVLDEKQGEGTEVTIAQGVADFAELAGVDDAGHIVGNGVDEGAETK